MMKKFTRFWLMAALLLLPALGWAQDELTVANGTATNSNVPIRGYWGDYDQHSQVVYPADSLDELSGATISSLTFYTNSSASILQYGTFVIKLGTVDDFGGFPSTESFLSTADFEEVFSGVLTLGDSYEILVEFDSPYTYDGGDLVVDFVWTNPTDNYGYMYFLGCNTPGHYWSANGGYSYTQNSFLPKCTFGYTVGGGSICRKPQGVSATADGPYGGNVYFTPRDEHESVTIMWADHPFDPNDEDTDAESDEVSDSPYALTGLTSSTTYYVYVRGNCDDGNSAWVSTQFTTDILCYPVVNVNVQSTYTTAAVTWDYQDGMGLPHDEVTVTLTTPTDPDFSMTVTTDGTYAFFSGLEAAHAYLVTIQNSCEGEPSADATKAFSTTGSTAGSHPGNVSSSFAPFYPSSNFSYTQTLYLSSEVEVTNITGVEYNTVSSSDNVEYILDVYAANTTQTSLTSTSMVPFSNFVQVVDSLPVNMINNGWLSVPFSTPFVSDGSNLVLMVVSRRTGSSGTGVWNGININDRVAYAYGDAAYDASNPPSTSSTTYMAGYRFLTQVDLDGCLAPNVLLTDVDSNSMHVAWVAGNDETSFTVEYRAEGATEWTVAASATTDLAVDLTDLNPNTYYTVRVSPDCEEEGVYASASARTACATPVLPLTEGFEGFAAYTQPSCWTLVEQYSNNYPSIYTGSNAHSGNAYYYTYASSSQPSMLASTAIPLDADNIYCSFWARGVHPGSGLTVGVMTNPAVPSSLIACTAQPTGQVDGNWTEYEFTTAAVTATGEVHVAFRWTTANYGYLDDIYISEIPACMRPAAVTVNGVTDHSATVNITGNADATGYTITLTGGAAPETVTLTGDESYTFTTLTASTSYTVQVASICGSESSDQTTNATFTTACGIVDQFPYTDQFNVASDLDCWTILSPLGHTGNSKWHFYTNTSSHEYVSYPSAAGVYNSSPSDEWLITPGFLLPADAENYIVEWYHFGQGVGSGSITYEVRLSTTGTAVADFDTVLFSESHGGQVFEYRSLSLADFAGDTVWIAFHNVANGGTGMIIDDVTVRDAGAPMLRFDAPTLVDAGNDVDLTVTLLSGDPNGLTFNWTSSMQAAGLATLSFTDSTATVNYSAAGFDTVTVTATNAFGTATVIAVIQVRNCVTITHEDLPYTENFDSYSTGTSASIDPCWTRISLYPSYPNYPYPYGSTHHGNSGNSLYFYPGTSSQPELAVLPQFDSIGDLYANFWIYRVNSNVRMEVGVMTDPSDASSFTLVEACEPSVNSSWQEFNVSFASYTGTGRYIAFRGMVTSSNGYSIYLDDVTINSLSTCTDTVRSMRVSGATEDGFTVSWEPGFGLSDGATLTLLSDDGTTLQTVADATSPYTFTGLDAETSYQVRVDILCNGDVTATATRTAMTRCEGGSEVEISAATTGLTAGTNHYAPVYFYYNHSYTQQLFTADELGNQAMGINSIAFNYTYATPSAGYTGEIYLRLTTESTLGNHMSVIGNDDEQVFSGTFSFTSGWCTFEFDAPFMYDGTSNLVLTVKADGSYLNSDDRFASHTAPTGTSRYYGNDNSVYSGGSDYSNTYRSDVRFGVCGAEIPGPGPNPQPETCDAPTNLHATATTQTSLTFDWTAGGSEEQWQLEVDGQAQVANAHPYTVSGLQPGTSHSVRVRAVCGSNDYSDWTAAVTATTDEQVGIDNVEFGNSNFELYPNPASVSVTLQGVEAGTAVEVISLNGQVMVRFEAQASEPVVDLTALPSGVYFVRLQSDAFAATRKLVVTR